MSSLYVTEPVTNGKAVLNTTLGPIEVEFWPKQAPMAVRNFIQLSLEHYYDGTIMHRIIRDFIVQGGDPTGTGDGGEAIYESGTFPLEAHSRLRFNRRGLLATTGAPNGSQFFFTLSDGSGLEPNKFTIFGKVVGDTLFNLLKVNDYEVGPDDRPTFPPKVKSIDVVSNPFDDIVPRERRVQAEAEAEPAPGSRAAARKAAIARRGKVKKKLSLLSFDDDLGANDGDDDGNTGMMSSFMFSKQADVRRAAKAAREALKRQQVVDAEERAREAQAEVTKAKAVEEGKRKQADMVQSITRASQLAKQGNGIDATTTSDAMDFADQMRRSMEARAAAAAAKKTATAAQSPSSSGASPSTVVAEGDDNKARQKQAKKEKKRAKKERKRKRKERRGGALKLKQVPQAFVVARDEDGVTEDDSEARQRLIQRYQERKVARAKSKRGRVEADVQTGLAAFRRKLAKGGSGEGANDVVSKLAEHKLTFRRDERDANDDAYVAIQVKTRKRE